VSEYRVRALRPTDAEAARDLVIAVHGDSRHEQRALELLDDALRGSEHEKGLIAVDEQRGATLGVALYGDVAGAARATKVHLLAAGDQATLDVLAGAMMDAMSSDNVRIVVAEIPDEGAFGGVLSALRRAGFEEEGHVADWFADGVGLRLLSARPG
jgi:hypothetical protein